jgi:hypothetical protein
MNRRTLLVRAALAALAPVLAPACAPSAPPGAAPAAGPFRRVRPGDPAWPDAASWERLNRETGGQLVKVQSPIIECLSAPQGPACAEFFRRAKNPYYLGDAAGLTQTDEAFLPLFISIIPSFSR